VKNVSLAALYALILLWPSPVLAFPGIPGGYPAPVPIPYVQSGWRNGDWANPHYLDTQTDTTYTGHPEWGPVGVSNGFGWRIYDGRDSWEGGSKEVFERFLSTAAEHSVYLCDGRVIPKPVILSPNLVLIEWCQNWDHGWCDLTPQWVYRECGIGEVLHGRLVGHILHKEGHTGACTEPGDCMPCPAYENECWRAKMEASLHEIGDRYDADERLGAVMIPLGMDGEVFPIKAGDGGKPYQKDFTAKVSVGGYKEYTRLMVKWFREAFPSKPIYIQGSWRDSGDTGLLAYALHPRGWVPGESESDYYTPPVGYKINAMTADGNSQFGWSDQPFPPASRNELPYLGGWWKTILGHNNLAPTALESGPAFDLSNQTFAYLAGLTAHPGWMDTYKEWFENTEVVKSGFVTDHLGKTIENTPDVWVALRDTTVRKDNPDWWSSGKYGDWEYWLYRVEDTRTYPGANDSNTRDYTAGGNTYNTDLEGNETVVIGDAPFESRESYFGDYSFWDGPVESLVTRRTDQAHGNNFMSFIVDGEYPPKKGGQVGWKVSVRYFDRGTDKFWIDYTGSGGTLRQSAKITKGNSQAWETAEFYLADAKFGERLLQNKVSGGQLGVDFRLNAGDDGDEIIHLVKATSGLDLSEEVVEFDCWQGACSVSSGSAEVEIRNLHSGNLGWRAVAEAPWLRVSKNSGSTLPSVPDRLTITVDSTGLDPSPHYRNKAGGQETQELIPYQAYAGIHSQDSAYPIYRTVAVRLFVHSGSPPASYLRLRTGWNKVTPVANCSVPDCVVVADGWRSVASGYTSLELLKAGETYQARCSGSQLLACE